MNPLTFEGRFLIVGSGETFNSAIVDGAKLLDGVVEMVFGALDNCHPEERRQWQEWLNDPDAWQHDDDHGPVLYDEEIGETDRLRIIRITEKSAPAFPLSLSAELDEVLGLMTYQTAPLARAYRDAGVVKELPRAVEREQAFILHKLILLALQHGPDWRGQFSKELEPVINAAEAASATPQ